MLSHCGKFAANKAVAAANKIEPTTTRPGDDCFTVQMPRGVKSAARTTPMPPPIRPRVTRDVLKQGVPTLSQRIRLRYISP